MSDLPITRVHYYDGQYLRLQDFTDEQAYHVGVRRRHNIGGHSWGIVRGLEMGLEDPANGRGPYVDAGMAIDGYGRELILVKRQDLDVDTQFDINDSDILDVWLTYGRTEDSPVTDGYGDCRCPDEDPDEFDRFLESPQLLYEAADLNTDRRHHSAIPDNDVSFGPERTPPDDVSLRWPVYVGRLYRTPKSSTSVGNYTYQVDQTGRPYAGLVGEWIVAPSGLAIVQLGAEPPPNGVNPLAANGPQPPALGRFAVFVQKVPRKPQPAPAKGQPSQPSRLGIGTNGIVNQDDKEQLPRLEIDAQGNVTLLGHTRLYGDLTVDGGGAVEFRVKQPDPTAQAKLKGTAAQTPPPWIIYKSVGPDPIPPDGQTVTKGGGGTSPAPQAAPAGGTGTPGDATAAQAAAPDPKPNGGARSSSADDAQTVYDLRVVIDNDNLVPGEPTPASLNLPTAPNRFSVGSFSKDTKQFQPVLMVSNQGVTVYGDLVLKGQLKPEQSPVPGALTPQALALVNSAYMSGLVNGGAPIPGLTSTPLDGLALFMQDAPGRAAIKEFLDKRSLFEPLVALLLETEKGASAIATQVLGTSTGVNAVLRTFYS